MENFNIRHRSVKRENYTRTSNTLLFGYRGVSDSAKITYQVIDAFDWTDKEGSRKGFAFPTLARLASLRGTTDRTIRRHLAELEASGLLTRRARPGYSSLLVIEDPSADRPERYLDALNPDPDGGEPDGRDGDDDFSETPDKIVRPPRTFLSASHIQQRIQTEESKNNVDQTPVEQRRGEGGGSTHISSTLQRRALELRAQRTTTADQRADVLANEMCDVLGDPTSRAFFLVVARTVPAHAIYETLGQVKETAREGRVKVTKGAMFTHLIGEFRLGRRVQPRYAVSQRPQESG